MSTFEEILTQDGYLVYRTKGVSMEPMLHQNRDIVIISTVNKRLKPMDVALYKRGKSYVLHRVIKDMGNHYLIRGDNTYSMETVLDSAIIGVLTDFQRKGKRYNVSDFSYQFYARFWHIIYPLRYVCVYFRRLAVSVARKLGVLPIIKKILSR